MYLSTGNEVSVRFVDHGDQEDIQLTQIHELLDSFKELPGQVISMMISLSYCWNFWIW